MTGKLISYDFDGVCHAYTSKWVRADIVSDPPVRGAYEHIHQVLDAGYRVAVFSSRSGHPGGIEAMRAWFERHGMPRAYLDRIEFPTEKPPAHLTIDDRAFHFRGLFPSLDQLRDFTPWNKQPSLGFVRRSAEAQQLGRQFSHVCEVWELRSGDPFRYMAVVDEEAVHINGEGNDDYVGLVQRAYANLVPEGTLVCAIRRDFFTPPKEHEALRIYVR